MAAVLEFRCDMRRSRRRTSAPSDGSSRPTPKGQIVIFPGVRIERHAADLSHRPGAGSAAEDPARTCAEHDI